MEGAAVHPLWTLGMHQTLTVKGTTVRRVHAFTCPRCLKSILPSKHASCLGPLKCYWCGVSWSPYVHPDDRLRRK